VALLIAIAAGPITLWPVAIWIFVAILHVCLMIIDTLLIEVSMGKVLKALQEQEIYRGYDYVLWICDDMY
jgi:hypothetical protein